MYGVLIMGNCKGGEECVFSGSSIPITLAKRQKHMD